MSRPFEGMSIPTPPQHASLPSPRCVFATGFSWQRGAARGRAVRGLAVAGGAVPALHEGGGDPQLRDGSSVASPVPVLQGQRQTRRKQGGSASVSPFAI